MTLDWRPGADPTTLFAYDGDDLAVGHVAETLGGEWHAADRHLRALGLHDSLPAAKAAVVEYYRHHMVRPDIWRPDPTPTEETSPCA